VQQQPSSKIALDNHADLARESTSAGFSRAAPAMMTGYLISLILDRVVLERLKRNRKLPDWLSQHSHSHGTPDDHHLEGHNHHHNNDESDSSNDNNSNNTSNDQSNKKSTPNDKNIIQKEDVNVVDIPSATHHTNECHHRQRNGSADARRNTSFGNTSTEGEKSNNNIQNKSTVAAAASTTSPTISSSVPSSPSSAMMMVRPNHRDNSSSTSTSTVLTIAVLMSLHSAIEGTTLALETSAKTLRGAFIPLFIHRFFDGVVVGLQATVVSSSSSSSSTITSPVNDSMSSNDQQKDSNDKKNQQQQQISSPSPFSSFSNFFRELSRIVFRKETLVLLSWSVITPVVLVIVLLMNYEHGGSNSNNNSHTNNNNKEHSPVLTTSFAGAWAQCFAAGSFVYISGELLNDVFTKSPSSLMMMNSAKDWISVNIGNMNATVLGLIVGVGIVLGLEAEG